MQCIYKPTDMVPVIKHEQMYLVTFLYEKADKYPFRWDRWKQNELHFILYLRVFVWRNCCFSPFVFLIFIPNLNYIARSRCILSIFCGKCVHFISLIVVLWCNSKEQKAVSFVFSSFRAPAFHIADTVNITDAAGTALPPLAFSHFLLSPSVRVFIYQSI